MSAATFQLRKRRKEIYEKMKVNPAVNTGLTKDFIGYQNQVGKFINGFKKHLTNKEISIWRNKVRQTESDVRHFQEENEILKLKTSASHLREVSSEAKTFVKNKIPQENDDLIQFEDWQETESRSVAQDPMSESSFNNEALANIEENIQNPSVDKIFANVKTYELACETLPEPPTDLDVEIEEKLLKLKHFNKKLNKGKIVGEILDNVNERFEMLKSEGTSSDVTPV